MIEISLKAFCEEIQFFIEKVINEQISIAIEENGYKFLYIICQDTGQVQGTSLIEIPIQDFCLNLRSYLDRITFEDVEILISYDKYEFKIIRYQY